MKTVTKRDTTSEQLQIHKKTTDDGDEHQNNLNKNAVCTKWNESDLMPIYLLCAIERTVWFAASIAAAAAVAVSFYTSLFIQWAIIHFVCAFMCVHRAVFRQNSNYYTLRHHLFAGVRVEE